jgi:N-succinyldiaminopimelate aminotransferase
MSLALNPLLQRLQPYPFERLRALFAGIAPNPAWPPINLGIGEPRHPTPAVLKEALHQAIDSTDEGLAQYPATAGSQGLRAACAAWVQRRYGVQLDPASQVLPTLGSREALFALAQVVIDPRAFAGGEEPVVVCPNPFYQIYEGAALLAGATPWYVPSDPARNFGVRWDRVPDAVWARTRLVYACSPGNPTGAVMPLEEWEQLFALSDRYGFVIASDECYSEIYFRNEPPLGALQAAAALGRHDFRRLIMLTSLSKRSNAPGLRSGFVAGDAELIRAFTQYRTYHGSAMSLAVQRASAAAWADEAHVAENRALYRAKFEAVTPLLADVMDVRLPDAGFYLWARVPGRFAGSDTEFARALFAQYNVTVLPGSFLARSVDGSNPGAGRVRMALVADLDECLQAAQRIVRFVNRH